MSYNINNFDYYENLTDVTEMVNDQIITYNENDDFLYDAELIPCNDTHYCITLDPNSEVNTALDDYRIKACRQYDLQAYNISYPIISDFYRNKER